MTDDAKTIALIDQLRQGKPLTKDSLVYLIKGRNQTTASYAAKVACDLRDQIYGKTIFIRGLIEFTNYCRNDCYYCGIRKSNEKVHRYRLSEEEILSCCDIGYKLGFRTFVLQGGEDAFFTSSILVELIKKIKFRWPDCALTLSIGERPVAEYKALYQAGADRFLLRHETYNSQHYKKLHPSTLTAKHRQDCLHALKQIGFHTGAGFMVGSPYQTPEYLAEDLLFLQELEPEMVGIGPFVPHHQTPFKDYGAGSIEETLYLLSIIRILLPKVLLPATTALGAIDPKGRTKGILSGANVVMPNLSPTKNRGDYSLYDNKPYSGLEAAEHLKALQQEFNQIGYRIVVDRGDPAIYQ